MGKLCIALVNYIEQKENEIKNRYSIQSVKKILIITEENEKQD